MADIVTIQHGDDLGSREIAKFYFMVEGQQDYNIGSKFHGGSPGPIQPFKGTLLATPHFETQIAMGSRRYKFAESAALECVGIV